MLHFIEAPRAPKNRWKQAARRTAVEVHYPCCSNNAEEERRRTSSWSPAQLLGPRPACMSPLPAAQPWGRGRKKEASLAFPGQGYANPQLPYCQMKRAASVCSNCLCANIKHVLQLTCKECVSLKRICSSGEHKTQLCCLIVSHPPDRNNRQR